VELDLVMFRDRVVCRVRVWFDLQAPPIMSREGELDIKLHPFLLKLCLNDKMMACEINKMKLLALQ